MGGVDDAGGTLGVGDPAVAVERFPDCGCDGGSQNELDHLDRHVLGIVSGAFRRLTDGRRTITVIDGDGWSATGLFGRREDAATLADPGGWEVLAGASWLDRG